MVFLQRRSGGYELVGATTAVEDGRAWAVRYEIVVDDAWLTAPHVSSRSASGDHEVRLEADGCGHWRIGDSAAPELDGCFDVDLEASSCTNTLPVHRLGLAVGDGPTPGSLCAGRRRRCRTAGAALCPDRGRRRSAAVRLHRAAFDYKGLLVYDGSGLVLDYPASLSGASDPGRPGSARPRPAFPPGRREISGRQAADRGECDGQHASWHGDPGVQRGDGLTQGRERLPTRQTRRTRPSVPVTFAAATPTAGSPPPPANSIVLAVGEAATAPARASSNETARDPPGDAARGPDARRTSLPDPRHARARSRAGRLRTALRPRPREERRRRLARQGNQISTPFVTLPGLVSGECASQGGFNYLSVTVNADPSDPRADDIGGDLTPSGACTSSTYRSSWATSSSGWRTRRRRTRVERRRAVRPCVTCSMPMPRAESTDRRYLYPRERERCSMPGAP